MKPIESLPPVILSLLNRNHGRMWLAGGAMRFLVENDIEWEDVRDWDIFLRFDTGQNGRVRELEELGFTVLPQISENAINLTRDGINIQLCFGFGYTDLINLLDSFDFVCCAAGTDGRTVSTATGWAKDVKAKALRLHSGAPSHATSLLSRASKYIKKGFTPVDGFWRDAVKIWQEASIAPGAVSIDPSVRYATGLLIHGVLGGTGTTSSSQFPGVWSTATVGFRLR